LSAIEIIWLVSKTNDVITKIFMNLDILKSFLKGQIKISTKIDKQIEEIVIISNALRKANRNEDDNEVSVHGHCPIKCVSAGND